MLAMAIYSNFEVNVDIYKVNLMLALHENEEIKMPDFTPFDNVRFEERKKLGKESVNKTCKQLAVDLINEFNERKTQEAKFAYLCDKLEADLQAIKYSVLEECSVENASNVILNDTRVKEISNKLKLE